MKPQAPQPAASMLATLNAHIAQAARAASEAAGEGANATGGVVGQSAWPALRSAQRFCETWERLGAEVQVQQAQARAPQNAGPLNPQRLMLDTLALMGELSPHYLRRFLAHAESLLWLEQAQGQIKQGSAGKSATAKSAKAVRQKR